MKTVIAASRSTVEICEILFCRMLIVLARIMMNGILQISAGWMENGRKLNVQPGPVAASGVAEGEEQQDEERRERSAAARAAPR